MITEGVHLGINNFNYLYLIIIELLIYIYVLLGTLEMVMDNLIIVLYLTIEVDPIGIIVKEVVMLEDSEDLVTIILKYLQIIEVVVHMVLIVPQMEDLNLKEVDGLLKMQMKIGI